MLDDREPGLVQKLAGQGDVSRAVRKTTQAVQICFSERHVQVLLPVVDVCHQVDDVLTQQARQSYISQTWSKFRDNVAQIRLERVLWVNKNSVWWKEARIVQDQRVACDIKALPARREGTICD